MANIFITTTAKETKWSPYIRANYERVMRACENDAVRKHHRVDDPAKADVILFVESNSPFQFDILRSDLYKRFPNKCILFDSQDYAVPLVPGIYMCIPDHLRKSQIYRYGFYIRVFDNLLIDGHRLGAEPQFLFSFVGRVANCERVRGPIIEFDHPRALVEDKSNSQADNDSEYVKTLCGSKFVLCPRGFGPSTWRCFEAMKAGRVPVIISDMWEPPPGLEWDEFAVRVPEAAIKTIPDLLEARESDAKEMGAKARKAWEANFALSQGFNWLADRCVEIQTHLAYSQRLIRRTRIKEVSTSHRARFIKDYIRMGI